MNLKDLVMPIVFIALAIFISSIYNIIQISTVFEVLTYSDTGNLILAGDDVNFYNEITTWRTYGYPLILYIYYPFTLFGVWWYKILAVAFPIAFFSILFWIMDKKNLSFLTFFCPVFYTCGTLHAQMLMIICTCLLYLFYKELSGYLSAGLMALMAVFTWFSHSFGRELALFIVFLIFLQNYLKDITIKYLEYMKVLAIAAFLYFPFVFSIERIPFVSVTSFSLLSYYTLSLPILLYFFKHSKNLFALQVVFTFIITAIILKPIVLTYGFTSSWRIIEMVPLLCLFFLVFENNKLTELSTVIKRLSIAYSILFIMMFIIQRWVI